MGLETGVAYIGDLNVANPVGSTDPKSEGDQHFRNIKTGLKGSFAGFSGPVLVTGTESGSSSAFAVTISPAPAAYVSGMLVLFKAAQASTGASTLQVNALGAKTLKTVTGAAISSGEIAIGTVCLAMYDGTDFLLLSGGVPTTGWVKLATATGGGTSYDFINGTGGVVIDSTYDEYLIVIDRLKPATDGAALWLRTTTDATNFDASASNYKYSYNNADGTDDTATAAQIVMSTGVGSVAATESGVSGTVLFANPDEATAMQILYDTAFASVSTVMNRLAGAGMRAADADIDGVRLMFSAGDITSGTAALYARRKG